MRDEFFMRKALQVAERGRGQTSPNPMVGALLVQDDGTIVGVGAHERAGEPHAEVLALEAAGGAAAGATLYCTLEPCSHSGRTPPCAPRVASAGVKRVVVATQDPNPLVAGRGLELLRAHGIDVSVGVLGADAERLNAPFFTVMRCGRPFVTMKIALSADGKVAARAGATTRLTGPEADRRVHHDRAEVDAIAIGSGTLLCDDPLLTARGAYRFRPLTRVVFDSRLRTPPSARILQTLDAGPVLLITASDALASTPERAHALRAAGAEILAVDGDERLRAALRLLAGREITSLLLEGGPALHAAFWDAGLVDRVHIYRTPQTLGPEGVPWLPVSVIDSPYIADRHEIALGADTLLEGYVHRTH